MKSRKAPRTFVRPGHGTGTGKPHVEIPRDAMPLPVAAPEAKPDVPLVFRHDGRIGDSETAKELGRRGGIARSRHLRLVDSLGIAKIAEESAFAPYRAAADALVPAQLAELAEVAAGRVSSAPSTMVCSGALQLAASRFAFDRFAETADPSWAKLASNLADASRQNFLAAYSHAVLEARARAERPSTDPHAALVARLNEDA